MEKRINRHSRILIPLPPVQSVKDKVTELVAETFNIIPEYIEADWFEGYAFSWRAWYGFEETLKYPSLRSFFTLHLRRILEDCFEDDGGEDIQAVEWIDEDRWEWLKVKENREEIFDHLYYIPYSNISSRVRVYDKELDIKIGQSRREIIPLDDWHRLRVMTEAYPVYKVLSRRGYWNGVEGREDFYKEIGFDFTLPF